MNVLALLEGVERMPSGERAEALPRLDGDLRRAVSEDMADFMGEVVTAVELRAPRKGAWGVRGKNFLCAFGWARASFRYRRGGASRPFAAFGVERNMTPAASGAASRLAVTLGSFAEAAATLGALGCGRLSESKVRDEALAAGEAALREQENPRADTRGYTDSQKRAPDGSREVPRTLVAMADGSNAPSVGADTDGVAGKNGGAAGSRQLRVLCLCEYERVTGKGVPIPIRGSFSYAVTDKGIADLTGMIRRHGDARGFGTVPRMQCVADGEGALEKAFRDAFPKNAVFTNDFMHASGYLSKCVAALGLPDSFAREGGAAVIDEGRLAAIVPLSGAASFVMDLDAVHTLEVTAKNGALSMLVDREEVLPGSGALQVYVFDRRLEEAWEARSFDYTGVTYYPYFG